MATERLMIAAETLFARTKTYAKDNSVRSWWYILSTAFLLTVATVMTLPCWQNAGKMPFGIRLCFSIFGGLLTLRLFVIYHDQQHHAILPKSHVAEIFMRAFGMWALSPSSI